MYVGGGMVAAGGGLGLALGLKRLRLDGHPYGFGEAQDVLDRHERGPAPAPQASLPAPAGRTVMLDVVSSRF